MNKEMINVVQSLANEKGIAPETIFKGMEKALSSVLSRNFPGDVDIRTTIDRSSGKFITNRFWTVVADHEFDNPDAQISFSEANNSYDNINIGDEIEEEIEQEDLGRIAAHQAKQIITRFVREAERAKMAEQYEDLIGEIMSGKVKRVTRDNIIIELNDGIEGSIARSEMIPREVMRVGDRTRAYLHKINWEMKGQLLELSRVKPEMLTELFKLEVPEISEGIIEVKAAAREAGNRAKIAVKANDTRLDPIGACIGIRGTRVQAVSNEFGGERIDIIKWDNDPAHLAINALSPAEVVSVKVDESTRTMQITVSKETLSQAIGRNGQNIRLASNLIGWKLEVSGPQEDEQEAQNSRFVQDLSSKLDIEEEISEILVREGFTHLNSISTASVSEISAISEFDEDIAEALIDRAKEALLNAALNVTDSNHISNLPSMTADIISQLASQNISSSSEIADMDVEELCELIDINEELAAKIILEARQPWFE